ncbi:MAG: bacteriohemerythrin [Austwickia sp.]|nr:bacteriohemerythrin [Actinomycetota bacterium]MCB1252409.1 hemerythrin family protein [Austwickia sp.]MCO5308439.1 bacteriohemerythrin [Austwickia sp.]
MALITWSRGLEVGFGDIDVQHRRLVTMLNRLERATSRPGNGQVAREVLSELAEYTQVHFDFEEHLMVRHGLADHPSTENHRAEHRRLVAEVGAYRERVLAGEDQIDEEVLYFLRDWLAKHILGTDRSLARKLLDAGATSAA